MIEWEDNSGFYEYFVKDALVGRPGMMVVRKEEYSDFRAIAIALVQARAARRAPAHAARLLVLRFARAMLSETAR